MWATPQGPVNGRWAPQGCAKAGWLRRCALWGCRRRSARTLSRPLDRHRLLLASWLRHQWATTHRSTARFSALSSAAMEGSALDRLRISAPCRRVAELAGRSSFERQLATPARCPVGVGLQELPSKRPGAEAIHRGACASPFADTWRLRPGKEEETSPNTAMAHPHWTVARLMDRFQDFESKQQQQDACMLHDAIGGSSSSRARPKILLRGAMGLAFQRSHRQHRGTAAPRPSHPAGGCPYFSHNDMPAAPATASASPRAAPLLAAYWGKVRQAMTPTNGIRAQYATARGPGQLSALAVSLGLEANFFDQRRHRRSDQRDRRRRPSPPAAAQKAQLSPSAAATGRGHRLEAGLDPQRSKR